MGYKTISMLRSIFDLLGQIGDELWELQLALLAIVTT